MIRLDSIHTAALEKKGKNVSENKDFRQPLLSNKAMRLAIHKRNDSPQLHVDCRGKERRCDEKEERLGDIRSQSPVWRFFAGHTTGSITNKLN